MRGSGDQDEEDLNVSDKASIKAGPQLNIKASRVNIN